MTFDEAFDRVIGAEGSYVNNPVDPGGETKWGISRRSYPNLNISALTRDAAKVIYHEDFWAKLEGDHFPSGLMFQVFDFAVNSGVEVAIRYLQRVLGVADDGYWGPVSRSALFNAQESEIVLLFSAERLDFMTRLVNWPNASRGWARRIAKNLRYAANDQKEQIT